MIGPIIAMLQVPALPGSPRNELPFKAIADWVLRDAGILVRAGVHALMLENFGDIPFFPRRVPPHTIAFMSVLGQEVRRAFDLPIGINLLRNDAQGAIAVAAAVPAQFVRVNVHAAARLTDQGLIEGTAHKTLRYRKLLGADVKIFADADVKHSAPLAARGLNVEVEELFSRGCADAVIVTGRATGIQPEAADLKIAKDAAGSKPVYAGSGVTPDNISAVLKMADGAIVGTALKRDGITTNPVDPDRVRAFMHALSL